MYVGLACFKIFFLPLVAYISGSSLDDLTRLGEIRLFFNELTDVEKISIFSKYDPAIVENEDLYLHYKLKSK